MFIAGAEIALIHSRQPNRHHRKVHITTYKFIIDFVQTLWNYWTILQISIVFIYCLFGWLLIVVMVVKFICEQFSLMTSFNRYLDFDGHIFRRPSSETEIEVGGFIFRFLNEGSSSSTSITTRRNWFQDLQHAVYIIYQPLLWWCWHGCLSSLYFALRRPWWLPSGSVILRFLVINNVIIVFKQLQVATILDFYLLCSKFAFLKRCSDTSWFPKTLISVCIV